MVTQWKDKQGRAWSFRLTIGDAKRLKVAGYDIGDMKGFQQLFADALTFIEIVAEALRPQWEKENLSYEVFVDLLTEDVGTIDQVRECFKEGLKNFFLRSGEAAKAKIVDMAAEAAEKQNQIMLKRAESSEVGAFLTRAFEKDDADFLQRLEREEAKLFGETSPSAAESSASSPTAGPTES